MMTNHPVHLYPEKGHNNSSPEMPGGTIPLGNLQPKQLERLQADLQREVEVISASLAQLSNAVQRLTASKENASQLGKLNNGKEILVPLTSAIYVPGNLSDVTKVLIDIGTGFYVEKTPAEAERYFSKRATLLKEEQDKTTQLHTQKRQQLEAVSAVLQRKTAELSGMSVN